RAGFCINMEASVSPLQYISRRSAIRDNMRLLTTFALMMTLAFTITVKCGLGANIRGLPLIEDDEEMRPRHFYRDYGLRSRLDAFDDYGHLSMLCTTRLTAAGPVRASVFSDPSSRTLQAAPVDNRARAAALALPPVHGSLVVKEILRLTGMYTHNNRKLVDGIDFTNNMA
ncbi:unnamed protein product, partial [Leptidea sinapis]